MFDPEVIKSFAYLLIPFVFFFSILAALWLIVRKQPTTASATAPATPGKPPAFPDRSLPNAVETWLNAQIDWYKLEIDRKKREHSTPNVDEYLFWIISGIVVALSITYVCVVMFIMPHAIHLGTFAFDPRVFMYVPLGLYYLASFRSVATDKVAGAVFAGKPVMQFSSGLKFVFWGIFGFSMEPTTYFEAEFPGDADKIEWKDEEQPLGPDRVRPIYILTAESPAQAGLPRLPTDLQKSIGVSLYTQARLLAEHFFDLRTQISPIDPGKKEEVLVTLTGGANVTDVILEVVRQMRDAAGSLLLEVLGQMSLNELRQHMSLVNELLKLKFQEKVVTYGISLVEAKITNANAGHTFNTEIEVRGKALARRDETITVAEGEKQRRILEGEGTAAAELALLNAKADGYEAIGKKTGSKRGANAMYAETVGKLATSGNVIVAGSAGVSDLLAMAAAVKRTDAK